MLQYAWRMKSGRQAINIMSRPVRSLYPFFKVNLNLIYILEIEYGTFLFQVYSLFSLLLFALFRSSYLPVFAYWSFFTCGSLNTKPSAIYESAQSNKCGKGDFCCSCCCGCCSAIFVSWRFFFSSLASNTHNYEEYSMHSNKSW